MHGELAAGHVSREGTPKKKKTKRRNTVYADKVKDWKFEHRGNSKKKKKRKGEIECMQRRRRTGGMMRGILTLLRNEYH
jgi:hypothetical protein